LGVVSLRLSGPLPASKAIKAPIQILHRLVWL